MSKIYLGVFGKDLLIRIELVLVLADQSLLVLAKGVEVGGGFSLINLKNNCETTYIFNFLMKL